MIDITILYQPQLNWIDTVLDHSSQIWEWKLLIKIILDENADSTAVTISVRKVLLKSIHFSTYTCTKDWYGFLICQSFLFQRDSVQDNEIITFPSVVYCTQVAVFALMATF